MPIGFFLNSPTHHGLHHEKFLGNFSLYFNVWDRLMGTNHPEYAARFAKTTGGALAQSSSAHSLSA
jgi:sterol desaturase/sphingolipid hydroxylase (fatty acid hydroxylase superfamily)